MNIGQVTLDNGTTIGYGVDENGNPDFSVLEVQTDHEIVVIEPTISLNEFDLPVIKLAIVDIDEISDDLEFDDDNEAICDICGYPLGYHGDDDNHDNDDEEQTIG